MLGRTAAGLFWMARHLERAENTARLIEAGARISLTRWQDAESEWGSVLSALGERDGFLAGGGRLDGPAVWNHLLLGAHLSSVLASIYQARHSARAVRTALTRETFEAVNDTWRRVARALAEPVAEGDLPGVLDLVRERATLVKGTVQATMMRSEVYNFTRLGTHVERADSTARVLDVKYYVLLPSARLVGSQVDNAQWETILRSVSAHRAYIWAHGGEVTAGGIAHFLLFDERMPRSLAYCYRVLTGELAALGAHHGRRSDAEGTAAAIRRNLEEGNIESVMEAGLHETLGRFRARNAALAAQIEADYRFYG
jgi:uncharacterized alpha-E superfamily protein